MSSLPARHASSASQPVPPKPHRRPVALFPPDRDEDEYDLPGLVDVTTKRSVEKAPAPSKGSDDEEDTAQMDNEEDTAQMDDQEHTAQTDDEDTAPTDNEETAPTDNEEDSAQTDNEADDDDEEVTKKASSSKGRAGATNLTPTQWAVIVSID
jgi:FtsZ-interacting cell division protein ZipA